MKHSERNKNRSLDEKCVKNDSGSEAGFSAPLQMLSSISYQVLLLYESLIPVVLDHEVSVALRLLNMLQ